MLAGNGRAKGAHTLSQARPTPERLNAFCDGVFAVLITVLVLDLRPPDVPTFQALLMRWPTWLSYAVSYVFIAIVWANHHYLMRFARSVTPRLMWFNFAHLFSVSLLPLSTAWMAVSELAPQPVAFYAAVFFLVNLTYLLLIRELIYRATVHALSPEVRRSMGEHSLLEAHRLGFRAMQFNCVVSTNEPAIQLWQELGFKIVGTLPGVFRHSERGYVDAYVMFRSLPGLNP